VESPLYRKYAPDKRVEVRHLELDITPDFQNRTLRGSATLRFQPIGKPLDELRLDAIDLSVHSITSSEAGLRYRAGDKGSVLSFLKPIPVGKEAFVTVQYSA